jgi:6-phosphogluconolactonase
MVRETLLVGHARQASFVAVGEAALAQVPRPFASVLLGMGEDGHIASLFPDMVNLADGLAIDNESLCVDVESRSTRYHRVSMTLAALLQSDTILLLAFGDTKRNIIGQPDKLPVAALLDQTRTHVNVMWAP